MKKANTTLLASGALLIFLSACSGDTNSDDVDMSSGEDMVDMAPKECGPNEKLDEETGDCAPDFPDEPDMKVNEGDMPGEEVDMGEPEADMRTEDPNCVDVLLYEDKDGDQSGVDNEATNITACLTPDQQRQGYARVAGDCDDDDRFRAPTLIELCDDVDNDCDDQLNQGITCEIYAHGPGELYAVDPFKQSIRTIGVIDTENSLLDIDTHPDGTLYGISSDALFRYEREFGMWVWNEVGSLQSDLRGANGLAIDRDGQAYATRDNELFGVDLQTGVATKLGDLSGQVNSSGDCVIDKGNKLYMSSKDPEAGSMRPDDLVLINATNNTTQIIGRTNHARIYGLTAAWGLLYGLTAEGELITIDISSDGAPSTLIKKFDDVRFYGAASSPSR